MGCAEACLHPKEKEELQMKRKQRSLKRQLQTLKILTNAKEQDITDMNTRLQTIYHNNQQTQQQITAGQIEVRRLQKDIIQLQQQSRSTQGLKIRHQSKVSQLQQQIAQREELIQNRRQLQLSSQKEISQLQLYLMSIKQQIKFSTNQLRQQQTDLNRVSRDVGIEGEAAKREFRQKEARIERLENQVWQLQLQFKELMGDQSTIDKTKQALKKRVLSQAKTL